MRRVAQSIVVIVLAYTAVFFVLNVLPGDPIEQQISNPENPISDADADILRDYYRLSEPAIVQFGISVQRLFTGDLGFSLNSGQPVSELLAHALPSTLALAGVAFVLAAALGLVIALAAVFAPWPPVREAARSLPPAFLSLPVFVTGLIVLQLFSFNLGWVSAVRDEGLRSTLLAAVPLALPVAAPIAQVLIQGLSNAAGQPYVEVLRAKGLSENRIIFGHLLKNGSIPTVTIVAITVGELLAGSVITETIFNRTGIGYLTETAVRNQDTPIIQAVVITVSVTFVVINLLVDVLYPLIDPRIRSTPDTEVVPA
ncbi:ABC transporter permease [Mycolicibacterium bacteremicum]|uniref:Nickel ABC transporter permease n=1 Tax=Mycolicibacterium bacteremicum TaxID=564198 RepID=A0A1W9YUK5_MYCBA|nr:ABC transporter permease [Mycolicibacterium bacteremicum]ORA03755.1 nickel ABC transporter permease [Mycolicibacterium bacteremicum]